MIARVGESAQNGFQCRLGHISNRHGQIELVVIELLQSRIENIPAFVPFFGELLLRHGPRNKFRIAIAPFLFAVGGEEVHIARLHIARNMPDENRNRVAAFGQRCRKLLFI